jgi:hypothetical protein
MKNKNQTAGFEVLATKITPKFILTEIDPLELRVALLRRGDHLRGWARRHQYPLTTVYYALHGIRHGAKSQRILRQLRRELETT